MLFTNHTWSLSMNSKRKKGKLVRSYYWLWKDRLLLSSFSSHAYGAYEVLTCEHRYCMFNETTISTHLHNFVKRNAVSDKWHRVILIYWGNRKKHKMFVQNAFILLQQIVYKPIIIDPICSITFLCYLYDTTHYTELCYNTSNQACTCLINI